MRKVTLPRIVGFAVFTVIASTVARAQTIAANVTIDATTGVRVVDDRLFGANTACWDWNLGASSTLPLLQAVDMKILRYPGGSTADVYNWRNNTVLNTTGFDMTDGTYSTMGTSPDQFGALVTQLHAQAFITVNYGSGTVQDAADWVTYMNKTHSYGIKYWEIGNENYGNTWEYDTHAVKNDPYTYANAFKDFVTAMKAADPTIKVGAVVVAGEDAYNAVSTHPVVNPRTGVSHNGWTPVLLATLKSLGVTPDFIIDHRYEQNPGNESDTNLLQSASTWPTEAAGLRQQLKDYLGAAGANVEINCTENNSVSYNPGKQTTSLVNGLYLADSIGNLLQTEFNAMVWWDLRNGQETANNNSSKLYGWRQYGDYGIVSSSNDPYPTYRVFELLSHFARGGDTVIKTSGINPYFTTYAVHRVDGSLTILAINKYPSSPVNATLALTGFTAVAATATQWQYGITQDTAAQNGDTAHADVATSTIPVSGATFTASFPAYSVTVLSLPSPAPQITAAPSSMTVAANSTVALSVGASGSGLSYQWYANGQAIAGAIGPRLVLSNVTAGSGPYTVQVSNASGSVTSSAATVNVVSTNDIGRLVNLSVNTYVFAGQPLTMGFVTGGASGSPPQQQVLIRGDGPALVDFGIANYLADPVLTLFSGTTSIGGNDNWSTNQSQVNAADAATYAFNLKSGSLDAAFVTALNGGSYTAQVTGNNNGAGTALAELYDYTTMAYSPSLSRLINVSCRTTVAAGGTLTAGFTIGGSTAETVLIRAVGPGLTGFGVPGVIADPTVNLFSGSTSLAANSSWGGDAQIAAAAAQVYAFALNDPKSHDSALLVTLAPGAYTVQANSASSAGGALLIEVYEVR